VTKAPRRTQIMAILNVTDDSFSHDGLLDPAALVTRAREAIAAGADVLDIGAESTRPGARSLSLDEELSRLIPALTAVRRALPEARISIDTTKPDVFAATLPYRPAYLNSVAGLSTPLREVVLRSEAEVIITDPGHLPQESITTLGEALLAVAREVERHGLARERIWLDPGFGFGKTPEMNIAILADLAYLVTLGYPILLGASRKSTLGRITGNPVEHRRFATAATTTLAASAGVAMVRVHDVADARETLAVADAVASGWRPSTWDGSM